MNTYEFAEAFAALFDAALTAWTLYFSSISGYLVVAYLVGRKLTRSQLVVICGLFVVVSLVMAFTGFSLTERAIQLEIALEGERDALDGASYFLLAAQILGILAALKFMIDLRKER
mgnify:CR=1 FL=1